MEKTILNNRTTLSSINTGRKEENITYLTYKYTYRDLQYIIKTVSYTHLDVYKRQALGQFFCKLTSLLTFIHITYTK